jgi:hypothetical protein
MNDFIIVLLDSSVSLYLLLNVVCSNRTSFVSPPAFRKSIKTKHLESIGTKKKFYPEIRCAMYAQRRTETGNAKR